VLYVKVSLGRKRNNHPSNLLKIESHSKTNKLMVTEDYKGEKIQKQSFPKIKSYPRQAT
jgi:hypothetical protein